MKKILVVDDEESNRDLLSKVLNKEGFYVQEAQNGSEALNLLEKMVYDLVLMDLEMPVMNGYDTISAIRKELYQDINIIVLSANIDTTTLERLDSCNIKNYIHKPYQLQTMLSIIKRSF